MIRREILPLAKRRETLADGLAFEFDQTAALQRTLEDLVAFERECCSGLTWNVSRTSQGLLRLSIQGLRPDSDFFRVAEDAEKTGC